MNQPDAATQRDTFLRDVAVRAVLEDVTFVQVRATALLSLLDDVSDARSVKRVRSKRASRPGTRAAPIQDISA